MSLREIPQHFFSSALAAFEKSAGELEIVTETHKTPVWVYSCWRLPYSRPGIQENFKSPWLENTLRSQAKLLGDKVRGRVAFAVPLPPEDNKKYQGILLGPMRLLLTMRHMLPDPDGKVQIDEATGESTLVMHPCAVFTLDLFYVDR